MIYGGPHLLSDGERGVPLTRACMQQGADQTYSEDFIQREIDRCPTLLPIQDFYSYVESLCSLGREIPVPMGDGGIH